ncbi:hypothetical protein ACMD2_12940 [Ananas comosus]|uniref:DUF659 domain-containing protein n=1 Tax=Ananas comosus TaxID=4615 RepID=A0A199UHQ1_ANACO|nr:hypothetical protein ACMD2_12940 [Ananas comosus]
MVFEWLHNYVSDLKGRAFTNVIAYSPGCALFINSFECSRERKTAMYLKDILSSIIEDIGPNNVVQLITNNGRNFLAASDMLVGKYPRMYKTRCVAHATQKELKHPCATRFASNFFVLQSLVHVENELRLFVASAEWRVSNLNKSRQVKKVTELIQNYDFWNRAKEVLQALEPVVRILRLVDGEGSTSGYLYDAMEKAKETIKCGLGNNQNKFIRIWELFDERRNENIMHPIHAAAALLNPAYICREGFRESREMKDSIGVWWNYCGDPLTMLRKYAVHILNQPYSSSSCERNWSAYEAAQTKKKKQIISGYMEDSNGYDVKLSDSASRPEGLLRANKVEEPPLGTHKLQESEEDPIPQGPATSKRTTMQGRCYGYGEEYITGKQCKNSSLHMLPAQKKGDMDAESETVKEEGCELQQVEEGNVYEATSIKESNNQTQLILNDDRNLHSLIDFGIAKATRVEFTTVASLIMIANPEHKVPSKNSCLQFARKKPGHKFFSNSRKWRLKSSDIVLRIDWMKKYRQVPFDSGPNKVTTHSIEGVDLVLSPGYLKTYKLMRLGPKQGKVTIYSMEERVSQRPVTPIKLHQFSNQQEVEIATMLRQQERSQDLKIQRLLRNSNLEEAYIAYNLVHGYKELGSVLGMAHPCSRFLAYEQAKLKESIVEWAIALDTSGIWQIYRRIELFFRCVGIIKNLQQLVQEYVSCLIIEEENKPKQSYEWWSIAE